MVVPTTRLTLIGKPDCHLCDDARAVVGAVIEGREDVTLEELSIHDDAELNAKYWDEIPVLMIDGRVHAIWRVDAERLASALG
ncbi:MAG: thioredoxin family protein [Micrococcales bacterium 70-64]|nr:glutaredoxin family protein [Leifsonia sp.]ODU63448.1 MAG: thioredoxin [Leifsonia sp. SCN 70-46]OJX85139.1 MAG: thioredoxin family protein [Micrococcales bacterium 70-64]